MNHLLRQELGFRSSTYYYHVGDGFYYHFERCSSASATFKCVKSRCNGRALLSFNGTFLCTAAHDHTVDPFYAVFTTHRHRIINEARNPHYVSFIDIVNTERNRVQITASRSQLTYRRLRSAMQRSRSAIFPQIPQNLDELATTLEDPNWKHLSSTLDLTDQLYCGRITARDGSQNVLFVSCRSINFLKEVSILFADSTYFIRPSIGGCYQVFTLVTVWDHTIIPIAWCLMERKTEEAYVSVLLLLRSRLMQYKFQLVICDFEDAEINAFNAVFGVPVQGCLFHSVNAMGSRARTLLTTPMLEVFPQMEEVVKLCCTLPLLPQHLIQHGLNVIRAQAIRFGAPLYVLLEPYLNYIQREWLNHAIRGTTMSVCGSFHRTNNASESNNRRMNRSIGIHHPNIYRFIRKLADFEAAATADLQSLAVGIKPNRHRATSAVMNDVRVQRLTRILLEVQAPTDEELYGFLQAASMNIDRLFKKVTQLPLQRNF